ncbi:MAG: tryptophan synthase subunit alpha [Nitriliruptoraceae bacterium]
MSAPARGPAAIAAAMERARDEGRAALIAYLTAGYPDPVTSRACLEAAVAGGADVVEVGLPFSDPIMDGPTIQAANQVVLDAGVRLDEQLAIARDALAGTGVPGVAMTYTTVADTRGWERFAADCAAAGLDGAILPDLPVPEAGPWRAAAAARDLAPVFLAASVSPAARRAALAAARVGGGYAVGLLGVTGVDGVDDAATRRLVERVRARTSTPVAVGIGVRDAADAARVAAYADGVIVGSALLRAAGDGEAAGAPGRVERLVADLRRGVAAGGRR